MERFRITPEVVAANRAVADSALRAANALYDCYASGGEVDPREVWAAFNAANEREILADQLEGAVGGDFVYRKAGEG